MLHVTINNVIHIDNYQIKNTTNKCKMCNVMQLMSVRFVDDEYAAATTTTTTTNASKYDAPTTANDGT